VLPKPGKKRTKPPVLRKRWGSFLTLRPKKGRRIKTLPLKRGEKRRLKSFLGEPRPKKSSTAKKIKK